MSARRPTLDEWFLAYQLRKLGEGHFYLPAALTADISPVVARWTARGARLSYPALVTKALALTARELPFINRCYVRTPLGDRVVDFDHVSVNLPIMIRDDDGREFLIAHTVKDADRASVAEIHRQIREAQARRVDETRVVKILARRPNTPLWRGVLRALHFAAYTYPGLERMGGGGLSVSSILTHGDDPPRYSLPSYGPTALTLLLTAVRREGERHLLELGIGFDHAALRGVDFRRAVDVLHETLTTRDPEALAALD